VVGEGADGVKGISHRNNLSGVYGTHSGSTVGPGVTGDGKGNWPGVWGRNPTADGVTGETEGSAKSGVYGRHNGTSGFGVTGDGKGHTGAGVLGRNPGGTGVQGIGGNIGVHGKSSADNWTAVVGEHTGSQGFGVVGNGKGSGGVGVLGRNPTGTAVQGEGVHGVRGKGSVAGYGGLFEGGRAQLKLVPKGTAGKPSGSHTKGEIYMDSTGALFICVASSTSTAAAKWRKVSTVAVP